MASPRRVYIGSFTPAGPDGNATAGPGITSAIQDPQTGELQVIGEPTEAFCPGFLTLSDDGSRLYAVEGGAPGGLAAFAVGTDGKLTPLDRQPSGGVEPCYVAVDPSGRFVVAANYGGGSVVAYRTADDGSLGERTALVQHTGTGPNASRQEQAHVHQTKFDASGRWLLVCDLGTDGVHVYALDPETGSLDPAPTPYASTAPGAGPRHAVSLSHGFVYVANELDASVAAFSFNDSTGELTPAQVCPSIVNRPAGDCYPSEIAASTDGTFLFVANRGADVVTTIRADGPEVTPVSDTPVGGQWPRHIAVIGDWLYVACENSDEVTRFAIDHDTGTLTPAGSPLPVPSPGCVVAAGPSLD
jgi:6-phosphogluconolactonase